LFLAPEIAGMTQRDRKNEVPTILLQQEMEQKRDNKCHFSCKGDTDANKNMCFLTVFLPISACFIPVSQNLKTSAHIDTLMNIKQTTE
jgi:hypothetical protein